MDQVLKLPVVALFARMPLIVESYLFLYFMAAALFGGVSFNIKPVINIIKTGQGYERNRQKCK